MKETLEEAAERLFKEYSNNTSLAEGHYDYMMDKDDFKEAFLEIAKWQQEKSYSEEDLRYAFECATDLNPSFESFNAWFKQFKKK